MTKDTLARLNPDSVGGSPATGYRLPAIGYLMALALAHSLLYAWAVPLWQAPDEPMLYEYAALTAELGRIPSAADRSPALEARILASLERSGFWQRAIGRAPEPPPATLAEAHALFFMPRQVGGDPPIYFALAAIPLGLTVGWSVEAQVRLLRSLGALALPLTALGTYLAARELVRSQKSEVRSDDRLQPSALSLQPSAFSPLASALLVALQPMAAFMGGVLSNDGLAMALGALLCWLLLRGLRGGLRLPWLAALALATLGALLVKRTALPYLLLIALLGLIWLVLAVAGGARKAPLRAARLAALSLAPFALLLAWALPQLDQGGAFGWYDPRSGAGMRRAMLANGAALALRPGDEVIQPLPALAAAVLRGDALRLGARAWSDAPASGRLVVDTGLLRQEYPFQVGASGKVEMGAYVPSLAGRVWLGVAADSGSFYVDNLWARGAGLPGDLLLNGDMGWPGLRPGAPLLQLVNYLRADELLWSLRSGAWAERLPMGDWFRRLFVSFWGEFGWMDVPLVRDSLWEPALAVVCAAGLLGALAALWQGPRAAPWNPAAGWGDGGQGAVGAQPRHPPPERWRSAAKPFSDASPPAPPGPQLAQEGPGGRGGGRAGDAEGSPAARARAPLRDLRQASRPAQPRRPLLALLALLALAPAPLLINAVVDPNQIQQGRYLLPLLPPLALVLALGAETWTRAWRLWPLPWAAFWLALAAASLAQVVSFYA